MNRKIEDALLGALAAIGVGCLLMPLTLTPPAQAAVGVSAPSYWTKSVTIASPGGSTTLSLRLHNLYGSPTVYASSSLGSRRGSCEVERYDRAGETYVPVQTYAKLYDTRDLSVTNLVRIQCKFDGQAWGAERIVSVAKP